MRLMFSRAFLFFIFITLSASAWSMDSTNKAWSSVTITGHHDSLLYLVEPQLRLIQHTNQFNQFLTNMGLGEALSERWQLWFGQTLSTLGQDVLPGSGDEYRLWQQILFTHPLSHSTFTARTRLEERKSFGYAYWAYRIRQHVHLRTPIKNELSLALGNEIMINLEGAPWITTQRWDQNRAYVGLTQKLSKTCSLSAGYMNQYLFTSPPQDDHVFIMNVLFTL